MKVEDAEGEPEVHQREIIDTNSLIKKGSIRPYTEHVKVYGAIGISVFAMIIAVGCLLLGVHTNHDDIITWSTTLMSGIVGSALTYAFTKKGE
jgi:hypothetical protein